MDSLRKSMKLYGQQSSQPEFQPILSDQDQNSNNHHDVVIEIDNYNQNQFESTSPTNKIDNYNQKPPQSVFSTRQNDNYNQNPLEYTSSKSKMWRGGSYDFSQDDGVSTFDPNSSEDPPSKLINSCLCKNQTTGVAMSPILDLEFSDISNKNSLSESCTEKQLKSSSSFSSSDEEDKKCDNGEVHKCTSNSSFKRGSGHLQFRAKTKSSRVLDPQSPRQPSPDRKFGWSPLPKSGQFKSGAEITKSSQFDEDDDDDPFLESDIPDRLKKTKTGFLTILQWLSLVLIIGALVCSLVIPVLNKQTVWSLHLWKWEVLVLVLICGRLMSGWFVRIAAFLIERSFLLRKRVLYFVYGVKSAVQNCLWLGLVLISWHYLFHKRTSHSPILPYVSKILLCLLVATILRLVKTLLVKVLASSFHVSTYFDRIQEALLNQYIIETLSGPPLYEDDQTMAEVQKLQNASAKMPIDLQEKALPHHPNKNIKLSRAMSVNKREGGGGINIDELHKLNQKNISAWSMKRLMRIVRYKSLTTLEERIRGREEGGDDDAAMHIRSENEAKIAAKKIFINVAKPGSKSIYLEDLMRFMRHEEALKAMNLFEGSNENKKVSRRSIKNWVVNAYKERKALALTLNDTMTAVNKLQLMANVVVGVIVFALWLLILEIATTRFFVFLSSQLLLAVFIFGNTLKTVFESIVFLFVMHSYDVGDRVEIDEVQYIVEEMNIMTTIFLRYDNLKVSYPNNLLATKPISNFYRSPDMGDSIDFSIHVATPAEKIAIMKQKIIQFMENKKDHWYPDAQVVLRDVDETNKLKVSIWMRQKMNFQEMGVRFERRELVVQEMIRVLRELDIEYRLHPLDVNLRNLPAGGSTRLPSTWSNSVN
ncbi:hypothetical protein LUZ60_016744 [Juncus effusus]|nr:hypothetical protein LUZ60_016744 [Juncus effusus]